MAQTVIGIFDQVTQAEAAVKQLIAEGFDQNFIDVSLRKETTGRGDITDENSTMDSKVGRFFQSVFSDPDEALKYTAVGQQGTIVAIHTELHNEAARAAGILDACGAVNVDERARVLEDSLSREDRVKRPGHTSAAGSRIVERS